VDIDAGSWESGNTALHLAAAQGHVRLLVALVEQGARLDVTNKHGDIPLHLAAIYGHGDCLSELLEAERALPAGRALKSKIRNVDTEANPEFKLPSTFTAEGPAMRALVAPPRSSPPRKTQAAQSTGSSSDSAGVPDSQPLLSGAGAGGIAADAAAKRTYTHKDPCRCVECLK